MSNSADSPAADSAAASSSQQQQQPVASSSSSSQPPAATEAESAAADDEGDEDDGEGEEEGDDDNVPAQLQPGGTLTSKQRKKKKSKAAAKLKKKLGMNTASSSSASQPVTVTPDMLSQVHSAVSKSHGEQAASKVNVRNLEEVLRLMNLERDATLQGQKERGTSATVKEIKDHKFWKTQPVMKPGDAAAPLTPDQEGPIHPSHPPEMVQKEPYPLPKDFEWVTIDIDNQAELKEVYELLSANYVEDDDASLRFNYSADFLHWVLKHPGYKKTWHIGVRVSSTRKLVAFISGIPHELRVREKSFQSTEINFLCVHKKLRSKRLAPVLIKEVTRQCHLTGVFQAIYTVGSVLPTPLSCSRYYHRTLNPEKLLAIGFAAIPTGMTKERWAARYTLPKQTGTPGLREMTDADVPQVGKLLRRYLRRFDMAPRFTDDEVRHILLSGQGDSAQGRQRVVWTYVVEDPQRPGKITDMASFYSLPSSVLDSQQHKILNAAYLFYYATDAAFPEGEAGAGSGAAEAEDQPSASSSSSAEASSSSSLAPWQRSHLTSLSPLELADERHTTPWHAESPAVKSRLTARLRALISDLMVIASQNSFDVLNSLTTLDNNLFLTELKFGPGDGFLRWYLYNWRAAPVPGGMGARPGEAELDPVLAASGGQGERTWMQGSGLGVAMV